MKTMLKGYQKNADGKLKNAEEIKKNAQRKWKIAEEKLKNARRKKTLKKT